MCARAGASSSSSGSSLGVDSPPSLTGPLQEAVTSAKVSALITPLVYCLYARRQACRPDDRHSGWFVFAAHASVRHVQSGAYVLLIGATVHSCRAMPLRAGAKTLAAACSTHSCPQVAKVGGP